MIGQWEVPFLLTTPAGSLPINQPLGTTDSRRWQLNPMKCSALLPVRVTNDDIPQGDGKIPHRRWRSGYGAHLVLEALQAFDDVTLKAEPACDEVLVEMLDELGQHVNEMIRTGLIQGAANARLIWTPSGKPNRMLDRCQLASAPTPSIVDSVFGGMQVEFDLDTPYPYYIEEAETETILESGDTVIIDNVGNTDFFAVWKVFGAYTGFTLTNHSVLDLDANPALLHYDGALPPGHATFDVEPPDYVEFVFYRGSAYLNGSQSSRIGGIRWDESDFFPLVPGGNEIEFVADNADTTTLVLCLSNGAFA